MAHKSFASLRKAILEKAKEGMEGYVLPRVQLFMKEAIQEEVYSVWKMPPRRYIRRHERGGSFGHGGLNDPKNIVGYIDSNKNGFTFRVENETMPDTIGEPQEYLTPLIVLGQENAIGALRYRDGAELYPYGQPRDFISATKTKLRKYAPAYFLEDYFDGKR